jgi:hypothetical protein
MFSSVSLLGTSSADLASGSDDVFKCANEDDPVTPNGGREHPRGMENLTVTFWYYE